MILWGTTFSKIQLRQTITDEVFNSGTLDTWVQLDHTDIVEDSETVTSYDGSVTYEKGTDYQMDYSNGKIMCLSSGSMSANTDYKIDYEYVAHEWTFDADDGFEMKLKWVREIAAKMKAQSGKLIESTQGWRLIWEMRAMEYNAYSLTDFLRLTASWRGSDKRIILYPRPSYLPGYEMMNPEDFGYDFLANKWIGAILTMKLISKNVFDNIPAHTGGTGDIT